MSEFTLALAGRNIRVSALTDTFLPFFQGYLTDGPADMHITTTMDDIIYERNRSAREDWVEGRPVTAYPNGYLETLAIYRKIANQMLDHDTLLFHGSAISVDGEGYLFTAKSGTGKSTHTGYWRQLFGERAVMVNDDKPLLRVMEDHVLVCGTPWNGKHFLGTNICVPLKGICILSRAEENQIRPLPVEEALPMLIQQSHRPKDPVGLSKVLGILDKLTKRTGLYALGCNLDPQAAMVAYRGMNGKE